MNINLKYMLLRLEKRFLIFTLCVIAALMVPVSKAEIRLSDDELIETELDCSQANINYAEEAELTQSERLHSMDNSFFQALNKFDECQVIQSSSRRSSASTGGAGTEGFDESSKNLGLSSSNVSDRTGKNNASGQVGGLTNGKVPDDIPAADNDSVLEAQIRNAAMNESDESIREKLWDEYRKYKGVGSKDE